MKEEDAQHAVAIYSPERVGLPLCQMQQPQNERKEEQQNNGTPDETLLLAYGTEDEVGVLFRHIFQFCLCAVEESLAFQPARTNGNLCLYHIVTGASGVVLQTEQNTDACLLVWLQNIVEHEVCGIEKANAA